MWSGEASARSCSIQKACCCHPLSFSPGHCMWGERKVWKLLVWKEDAGGGAGPPELQLGLPRSAWWCLEGPSLLRVCTPNSGSSCCVQKGQSHKGNSLWDVALGLETGKGHERPSHAPRARAGVPPAPQGSASAGGHCPAVWKGLSASAGGPLKRLGAGTSLPPEQRGGRHGWGWGHLLG